MTAQESNSYPNRFIFNEEVDAKGNHYKKAYSNKLIPCIICLDGKNILVKGRLNLFYRQGESKFGKELGVYFKVDSKESTYNTASKHEVVEFYLPADVGVSFIEQSLNHFKSDANGKIYK